MKNILRGVAGIILLGALAYGAVKTYVIDPKTVSSAEEILELFYETRDSLPPLPCPVSYETVAEQLAEGRVDFIATPNWAYNHDAGIYYLSENSELAKKLLLPASLLAYEDLASGKVVLAGIPNATEELQTLAVVNAPEFAAMDEKTSVDLYLMKELWPRRIIWTATLKPEAEAWEDLVRLEQTESMMATPMVMTESVSEEIGLPEGHPAKLSAPNYVGSTLQVSWYGMRGVSYQLQETENLLYPNSYPFTDIGVPFEGEDGYLTCPVSNSAACRFFRLNSTAHNNDADVLPDYWEYYYFGGTGLGDYDDPDWDGLTNFEEYDKGTEPNNQDTDGDGMWDGYEVYYEFPPLNGASFLGDNAGPLDDSDSDLVINIDEHNQGSLPDRSDTGFPAENGFVKWFGQFGWSYQLQGASSSNSTDWADLGSAQTGRNREISIGVSQGTQTWFRIAVAADNSDPDMDGLSNTDELDYLTDPYNFDTDNDGMGDGYEIYYSFDPLNGAATQAGYIGPDDDSDSDGVSNLDEHNLGSFPDSSNFVLTVFNDGGTNYVRWFGQFGWHYQLEGVTNIPLGEWEDLGSPHSGRNSEICVDVGPYSNNAFRVELSQVDLTQPGVYDTGITEVKYGSHDPAYPNYNRDNYHAQHITADYAFDRWVDTSPFYNLPEDGLAGNRIPINGILRIPPEIVSGEAFPLAIIVHGNSGSCSTSEEGYIYLCNRLASHGIIAATIDENFYRDGDGENDARAILLLEHVKQFEIWNATPGHPLEGKVNMNRIILIGHSRGGEAVQHASFFNRLEGDYYAGAEYVNFDEKYYHFDLKALIAIAPTEGQYVPTTGIENVKDNYLVIRGSYDRDVNAFQGYRTYDRAHPVVGATAQGNDNEFRALVHIDRACHNRFNTEWGTENYVPADVMDKQSHKDLAKYYITSFAYSTLFGNTSYMNVFKDNRIINTPYDFDSNGRSIDTYTQYQGADFISICDYQEDTDANTSSLWESGDPEDIPNPATEDDYILAKLSFLANSPYYVNMAAQGGDNYQINLNNPLDATGYQVLALRISYLENWYDSSAYHSYIQVHDSSTNATVYIKEYILSRHNAWDDDKGVMQTVHIPLADIADQGVDITNITNITFNGGACGTIYIDDLQLSK